MKRLSERSNDADRLAQENLSLKLRITALDAELKEVQHQLAVKCQEMQRGIDERDRRLDDLSFCLAEAEIQKEELELRLEKPETATLGLQTDQHKQVAASSQTDGLEKPETATLGLQTDQHKQVAASSQTDGLEKPETATLGLQTDQLEQIAATVQTDSVQTNELVAVGLQTDQLEQVNFLSLAPSATPDTASPLQCNFCSYETTRAFNLVRHISKHTGGGKQKNRGDGAKCSEPTMRRPKGLPNLGNTCFFNSTMQCLLTNWPFLQHYFDIVSSMPAQALCISSPFKTRVGDMEVKVPKMEMHLSRDFPMPTFWVFAKFVDGFHKDDTKRPSPGALFDQISKKVPRFRGMAQQDAHELLHYLVDMLRQEELSRFQQAFSSVENVVDDDEEEDETTTANEKSTDTIVTDDNCSNNNNNKQAGKEDQQNERPWYNLRSSRQQKSTNTPISRQERRRRLICQALLDGPARPVIDTIYGGVLQQSIKCERCSHVSVALEPFFDLSLPVKSVVAHGSISSLTDALSLFTAEETLRGDTHAYRCANCTKKAKDNHQQSSDKQSSANALKFYKVLSPPLVLILHFNRFEQIGQKFRKFDGHVQFPLVLNLAPFCSPDVNRLRPGQDRRLLLYRLCGVVSHSGEMDDGHYIAYVGRYPPRSDVNGSHFQPIDSLIDLTLPHSNGATSLLLTKGNSDAVHLAGQLDTLVLEEINNNNNNEENNNNNNDKLQKLEIEQQALDDVKHQSKWFCCYDSHVRAAKVEEVLGAQAFLLFYERIN